MDLSAVIFVVLALAWAVYLIPKALKHHDEMAGERLVEGHSDKVRILSRKARAAVADVADALTPGSTTDSQTETETDPSTSPAPEVVAPPRARQPKARPTRAAARTAARRRRRVLAALVLALVVVWGLTWFAYLPIWAPAMPGVLVVAWLVLARLSVRSQRRSRISRPVATSAERLAPTDAEEVTPTGARVEPAEAAPAPASADEFLVRLTEEDTTGLAREEIEAVLADDGSLWDPLPMTLPTYVNKARARRTVRTIELTGINSSGHDESDSALAREAAAASEQAAEDAAATRKAAGA